MTQIPRWRRWLWRTGRWGMLMLITLGLCLLNTPSSAIVQSPNTSPIEMGWEGSLGWPTLPVEHPTQSLAVVEVPGNNLDTGGSYQAQLGDPLQEGRRLYDLGQLSQAATVLQGALQAYRNQGDALRAAVTLSNLALVYGQLGQWPEANQAIMDSLQQLNVLSGVSDQNRLSILAQTLLVQGRLQLAQGDEDAAFAIWQQAADTYQSLGDEAGIIRCQVRQAQALQAGGFFRRAIDEILSPLGQRLQRQPDSVLKVSSLHVLGDALQVAGNIAQAQQTLEQALVIAQNLVQTNAVPADERQALNSAIAGIQLSLGNVVRTQADGREAALDHYQQAASYGASSANQLRAQLNQLSLLVELNRPRDVEALWPSMMQRIQTLPASRDNIYNRINFASSLISFKQQRPQQGPSWSALIDELQVAQTHAHEIGDQRSEAYVLGTLGGAFAASNDLAQAKRLTEEGVFLAKQVNAADITYRWQAQLGEILENSGDTAGAIAAYTGAVNTLKALRTDLVAVNSEVQFSFSKSIEPIHRKLVSLLLNTPNPSQSALEKARTVIESLQVEELNNYLRAACLNLEEVQIDEIAQSESTAIVYPIILNDRLATIVSTPTKGLTLHSTDVSEAEMERTLRQLRRALINRISLEFRDLSRQVYDWVIAPIEDDLATLAQAGTKQETPDQEDMPAAPLGTLVFVLDGPMRNVPMAALYDGEQYLIEKYALALTPSLQLLAPRPIRDQSLSVLAFGLSEGVNAETPGATRKRFSPLPNVERELDEIQTYLPKTQVLLNSAFTPQSFKDTLAANSAPIVHLATHGQFSSDESQTFIVTGEGKTISIEQLTTALKTTELNRQSAVELLVLSACETAAGDERAALGLAGVAVRAGARSTLASLWQVDDIATSILMGKFYQELSTREVTKSEALRLAQLEILNNPRFRKHPFFWAPFVLVGNWL